MNYAKLIDNQLTLAPTSLHILTEDKEIFITNPTEEQYLENGYKPIVYEDEPIYDYETETLKPNYTETEKAIYVWWEVEERKVEE